MKTRKEKVDFRTATTYEINQAPDEEVLKFFSEEPKGEGVKPKCWDALVHRALRILININ